MKDSEPLTDIHGPLSGEQAEKEQLLPCPFCGGEHVNLTTDPVEDSDDIWTVVCSMVTGGCGASSGCFSTNHKAIEAWNTRATPAGSHGELVSDYRLEKVKQFLHARKAAAGNMFVKGNYDLTIKTLTALQQPTGVDNAFQVEVADWLLSCFGKEIATDCVERNQRFIEEAIELVQACGGTREDCHMLVDYTFDRPVGEKTQEVGGVMVTLAALCFAQNMHLDECARKEIARVWTKQDQIREKQHSKPRNSPYPAALPTE